MGKFKLNGGGQVSSKASVPSISTEEIVALIKANMPEIPAPKESKTVIYQTTEGNVITKDKRARQHSKLSSKILNSRLDETLSILEENNKITSLNFREIAMLIQQDRHVLQQLNDELQSVKNENTLLKQQLSTQVEITKELSSRKPEEIQIVTNNTEVKEVHSTLLYVIAGLSMLVNIFVLFNI